VNVKKAVVLDILSTFLEELQSENVNLCTKEWLPTILLATIKARYRVD
jgi:hypothetical protein